MRQRRAVARKIDEERLPTLEERLAEMPPDDAVALLVSQYGSSIDNARLMVAITRGEIDGDTFAVDEARLADLEAKGFL